MVPLQWRCIKAVTFIHSVGSKHNISMSQHAIVCVQPAGSLGKGPMRSLLHPELINHPAALQAADLLPAQVAGIKDL